MYTEKLRQLERNIQTSNISDNSSDAYLSDVQSGVSVENCPVSESPFTPPYLGISVGVFGVVADVILSHPFTVIRNQCQVCSSGVSLHLTPFSLIRVVRNCVGAQGLSFLWKGLGSVFIVRSLIFMTENFVHEVTSLPKDVTKLSSLKKITGHLLLKIISWAVATPFYAASVVEIAQSQKASEPTSLISCLRDGLFRLLHIPSIHYIRSPHSGFSNKRNVSAIGKATTSRLLVIWYLLPPVVIFNVGQYIVRSVATHISLTYLDDHQDKLEREAELDLLLRAGDLHRCYSQSSRTENVLERTPLDWETLHHQRQETALQANFTRHHTDLTSTLCGNLAADVLLYPFETLVLRLCIQGTRTLVDDMDHGDVVVPIISNYSGFFDSLRCALDSPLGFLGLYRGFGAVITQYALHATLLYGIRYLFEQVLYMNPPSITSRGSHSPN